MILLDPAIGSKELQEPLLKLGLPVDMCRVDADIVFEGRGVGGSSVTIGVEYKKLHELIQALRSERLQGHQVPKMQAFDFKWLLVEGEVLLDKQGYLARRTGRKTSKRMEGSMTFNELVRRLVVLQISRGLQWVIVDNHEQTIKFIETLYRTWTDVDQDEHKSHIAIYEPQPLVAISQFRRTVATLPGIGIGISRRVEEMFPSIRDAMLATPEAWARVEGIGMKTAKRIATILTQQHGH